MYILCQFLFFFANSGLFVSMVYLLEVFRCISPTLLYSFICSQMLSVPKLIQCLILAGKCNFNMICTLCPFQEDFDVTLCLWICIIYICFDFSLGTKNGFTYILEWILTFLFNFLSSTKHFVYTNFKIKKEREWYCWIG